MQNRKFNFQQASAIVAVAVLMTFCKSTQRTERLEPDELIITQQRLECMGTCPVYTLSIYASGNVVFMGEKNVPVIGESKLALSKTQLQKLIDEFRNIEFFQLKEKYTADVSDGATTYISFRDGDREMKIMDYSGAPEKLKALENRIETLTFDLLTAEGSD